MSKIGTSSTSGQNLEVETNDVDSTWNEIMQHVTKHTSTERNTAPTMVFSVIGDSDNLVPRPWPKTVFKTALIEAAKSGGETWILYRGKDQGLSKVVREAYKSYEEMEFKIESQGKEINDEDRHVKLISISEIKTNESASSNEEKSKSSVKKTDKSTNESASSNEEKSKLSVKKTDKSTNESASNDKEKSKPSVKKTELTIRFKTTRVDDVNSLLDFEKSVSEKEVAFFSQKMDTKMPVPIAIIVCEGDIDTIEHISKALKKKLPVIIMKGSGMAADLVCERLENSDTELQKMPSILFGIEFDDNKYENLTTLLESIYKFRNLIGIFDLDHDDPLKLSNIIGETVVRCWCMANLTIDDTAPPGENGSKNDNNGQSKKNSKPSNHLVKNLTNSQPAQGTDTPGKSGSKMDDIGQSLKKISKPSNHLGKSITNSQHAQDTDSPGESGSKKDDIGQSIEKSSIAWKLLGKNFTTPQLIPLFENLFKEIKESRPYILNPKFSAPTSLPLYFFFGYQLLQESDLMDICGPVLLLEALKANRCDYVRVLLDRDVNFDSKYLAELYEQTVSCRCKFKEDCLHMQWILKQIKEKEARTICHAYKCLLKKKRNDKWKRNHKMEFDILPWTVPDAARRLCRCILRYKDSESELTDEDSEYVDANNTGSYNESIHYSSISDLLLWAIFANRQEMAEICWLRGTDHLLTGLVCSAVLGKLSKKAANVKEQILSNDLAKHSKLFEQRCLGMMDSMYEEDTKQAIKLMDDEANVWGIKSSPLTFAYENVMYDVVAHTCSQKYINRQWYNKLAPDLVPFFKSAFSKPKKFYSAPLTKYLINYLLFFSMLVMYSAFVLTSVDTEYYVQDIAKVYEYYVYFWGAGDLIEELISCFGCLEARGRSHRSYYSRMKRYLYDFWNIVDLLSYALLVSALFVRHFYIDESFTIARRMFALSLLVMYLRFLEFFLIHRTLGPTLIMIKEMLKDLLSFLVLAFFVVLGVGIYYHANLWPDHQTVWSGDWTDWRIWKIIYYPYWQLYGELNLDTLEGTGPKNCTLVKSEWEADSSLERCPEEDWTVLAIAAIYLLFSNLLLVNLVIAMFSYTFERVQNNSEKLWRFQRYTVINDYDWRIPSPLNIIFLPYRVYRGITRNDGCLNWCKNHCSKKDNEKDNKKREKREVKLRFRRNFQKIIAFRNHNKV